MRKLYPVSVSCGVLEVSASGYFNWLRRRQAGHGGAARRHSDEALLAYMRAIHAEVKGEYGWPRMHKELLARGIRVGKDRVRKLMQQHGIRAKTKRKFVVTTDTLNACMRFAACCCRVCRARPGVMKRWTNPFDWLATRWSTSKNTSSTWRRARPSR